MALHLRGNLLAPGGSPAQRFLYGAPIFAPLLLANLAVLAAIGTFPLIRGEKRSLSFSKAVVTRQASP